MDKTNTSSPGKAAGKTPTSLTLYPQAASPWSFLKPAGFEPKLYRRFHAMATTSDSKLFIFGGETKMRPTSAPPSVAPVKRMLDDLLCFDPTTNEWSVAHGGGAFSLPGPSRRKGSTLTAYQNRSLFLFGGAGPGVTFNDFWEFRLQESKWVNKTDDIWKAHSSDADTDHALFVPKAAQAFLLDHPEKYPPARAYHTAEVHEEKLILYGGHGVRDSDCCLYVYEIPKNEWRRVPLMAVTKQLSPGHANSEATTNPWHPGIRFGTVSTVYKHGLFIFGGQQNNKLVDSSLWRLDLKSFKWQKIVTTGSPPTPHTYGASTQLGNRWLVHGGSSADDVFLEAHELNLDSFHWHPSQSLSTSVSLEGHTAAFLRSSRDVVTLTLYGGATKGPQVPESPVIEVSFSLDEAAVKELKGLDNVRLEDLVIRPGRAAALLNGLLRQRGTKEKELEIKANELSQSRLIDALRHGEELKSQNADLNDRFQRLVAEKQRIEDRYAQVSELYARQTAEEKYRSNKLEEDVVVLRQQLERSDLKVHELNAAKQELDIRYSELSAKYGSVLNFLPQIAEALKRILHLTKLSHFRAMENYTSATGNKLVEVQKESVKALELMNEVYGRNSRPGLFVDLALIEVDTMSALGETEDGAKDSSEIGPSTGLETPEGERGSGRQSCSSSRKILTSHPVIAVGRGPEALHFLQDIKSSPVKSQLTPSMIKDIQESTPPRNASPIPYLSSPPHPPVFPKPRLQRKPSRPAYRGPGITRGVVSYTSPEIEGKIDIERKSSSSRRNSSRKQMDDSPQKGGIDKAMQCGMGTLRLFDIRLAGPAGDSFTQQSARSVTKGIAVGGDATLRL